jgi:hypothetical protein
MKIKIITISVLLILLVISFIFSFTSCAECIGTEYKTVEVIIVDSYHRNLWIQPVRTGKVTTYITHPARYEITVLYNKVQYTISGSETYNKYKDKIGETTTGQLEIRSYDDGTVKYDIISLE